MVYYLYPDITHNVWDKIKRLINVKFNINEFKALCPNYAQILKLYNLDM